MLFGFGNLIYIIVLLLNSLAILSEDRFLARIGYSTNTYEPGFGNDPNNAKAKTTNLIKSVQTVMRVPLVFINTFIIVYELVLG